MMSLYIWRHPKPIGAAGLCLGQTDLGVDKRKINRLANQILRFVRQHQLPKVVYVSPLQRSLKVGERLAAQGFKVHIAPELMEINFGDWDGQPWSQIAKYEIDAWCDDFAHFTPDNGESLQQLFYRVASWLGTHSHTVGSAIDASKQTPVLAIGHAGWINTAKMLATGQDVPQLATDWSPSVAYNELSTLTFNTFDKVAL